MARTKIIPKGTGHYNGLCINPSYDYKEAHLRTLRETLQNAIGAFKTATAVRMDFSIKKPLTDAYRGKSSEDINECFQLLLNRLHKSNLNIYLNWKLERSNDKGLHIHTVFYFNHNDVPTFTVHSKHFKKLKEWWLDLTDDNGNINICTSSRAKDEDSFAVSGDGKYYYTILGQTNGLTTNKDYHEQKNKLNKTAGFFHWISYLAKNKQQAEKRKTVGERSYQSSH